MPSRPKFLTEDSVKIVEWWCELKDIHKVQWHYAKEKGSEHFPRKLLTRKNFKCVKPKTLDDLKEVVSDFVESLDKEDVRIAIRPRAELCITMDSTSFGFHVRVTAHTSYSLPQIFRSSQSLTGNICPDPGRIGLRIFSYGKIGEGKSKQQRNLLFLIATNDATSRTATQFCFYFVLIYLSMM